MLELWLLEFLFFCSLIFIDVKLMTLCNTECPDQVRGKLGTQIGKWSMLNSPLVSPTWKKDKISTWLSDNRFDKSGDEQFVTELSKWVSTKAASKDEAQTVAYWIASTLCGLF